MIKYNYKKDGNTTWHIPRKLGMVVKDILQEVRTTLFDGIAPKDCSADLGIGENERGRSD